ncbi:MAG: endonuclease/exonuclease/phosphatase family protein, partial [Planctomycetota bacterium]
MICRQLVLAALCAPAALVHAQWSPATGQWGKTETRDVRVMAWNIRDGLCSTNLKLEGANNWCCLARVVAAMKPDVLILEECADNSGNGTGASVDSVANLLTTLSLFQNGGTDPFRGGAVTAYIKKYAPSFDLPYVWVSGNTDGFNRNVIMSRFPFGDLNGDTKSNYDQFLTQADLYSPGGGTGIRGWTVGEINLPEASYRGDMVIGCSHLKSGGTASDYSDRLAASQNIAYIIDYWYNGGGSGVPDPRNKVIEAPVATRILDPYTPVIWGGDLNEDENSNGRDGPALWTTRAASTSGDGTDRDRTDSTYDDARDPLNASGANRNTQGSSKLDYICWQDSIATLRRSYVYSAASGGPPAYPPEIIGLPTPGLATSLASDHKPVIADFILPAPPPPGPVSLLSPAAGSS